MQHAITNSLTLDASYVGNHGEHLFDYIDINQPNPGVPTATTTAGITSPGANTTKENAQRPYTEWTISVVLADESVGGDQQ